MRFGARVASFGTNLTTSAIELATFAKLVEETRPGFFSGGQQ